MNSPRKHPLNPLIKMGEPGSPDEWSVQFYGSIIRHEGMFKLWYVAADEEASQCSSKRRGFHGWRPAYAESQDGINWTKPNLGLVTYRGNRNNNLLLIDPPEASLGHLDGGHLPPGDQIGYLMCCQLVERH